MAGSLPCEPEWREVPCAHVRATRGHLATASLHRVYCTCRSQVMPREHAQALTPMQLLHSQEFAAVAAAAAAAAAAAVAVLLQNLPLVPVRVTVPVVCVGVYVCMHVCFSMYVSMYVCMSFYACIYVCM
jgi:hypothetical protein